MKKSVKLMDLGPASKMTMGSYIGSFYEANIPPFTKWG